MPLPSSHHKRKWNANLQVKKKKRTFKTVIQPINRKWLGLRPQIFLPVPRADNEKKNTKHLSLRQYSIECQKVIWDCSDFPLFYSVIGPKDSRHSRNQSDAKLKPITAWSPALSRALGGSVGFLLWVLLSFWMHRREKNIKVDLKKLFDGQINILKK